MLRALSGPLGLRRILAFMVDWLVVALYAAVLFGVVVLVNGGIPPLSVPYNLLQGQLLGFVALTVPVVFYFVYCEYRFGRTLGKYLLNLRVTDKQGGASTLGAVLVRNSLKFLPWELAHYTVHQFTAANLVHQNPQPSVYVALTVVYVLAGVYLLGIFLPKYGTLYDRVAGTRVVADNSKSRRV